MSSKLARNILKVLVGLLLGYILVGDVQFFKTGEFSSPPTLLTGGAVGFTIVAAGILGIGGLAFIIVRAIEGDD